jgi:hypothetical protein
MATEMIRGAEYMFGGERFTFVDVSVRDAEWGMFRHTSGEAHELRLIDAMPVAKPTPFPEPERWHRNEYDSDRIIDDHNAEIDRLMREIQRLEALVQK